MRDTLQTLDNEFAFQTSGRFDLLAGEHVAYTTLGAPNVDGALRTSRAFATMDAAMSSPPRATTPASMATSESATS
jgi:hypothetical protein